MSEQPTVLITGASSGIGRATARQFATAGFRVFGTSRHAREDEGGITMLQLDVRSDESVRRCVDEVLSSAGRIDILVNNAATLIPGLFAEETTMEEARDIFETNFFGVVRMVDAVLPGMRARRAGRIINVGSLAAWIGEPGDAFYAASKAALARYTEALGHELWPLGIRVSLVEPGEFRTAIFDRVPPDDHDIADYDASRESARNTLQKALQHGGDPAEAARKIVRVAQAASPRSRYAVGRGAGATPYLKLLLPQRLFDRILRRAFGLRKP